ncbi:MAG: glycosyltransferase family 4 protein [Arenicellales bacterium]
MNSLPARNLRILIVAPSAYLLGGVQNWLDYLMPGLEKFGYEVVLGLTDGEHHRSADYLVAHPWTKAERIINPTGSRQGRVNAVSRKILDVEPDIVFSVNIGDCLEAISDLREKRQSAARLVMTMHGIEADYVGDLRYYEQVVDGVIYTNRLIKPLIQTYTALNSSRLFYAPCGVNIPNRMPVRDSKPHHIFWMGRFDQAQKRCLELPLIAQSLPSRDISWKLILAGDGPEECRLRQGFDDIEVGRVEFLGHVPHKTLLRELLPTAGILLLNSSWETGPITIWEAMAAGVPVVTSRYTGSGVENSLEDQHNVSMFDVGDVRAAADCLQSLFHDTELRRRLVKNGFELVKQRYSISRSVDSCQRALRTIMALPPREDIALEAAEKPVQGRLDRWLGASKGEKLRRVLGRTWKHRSAGSEWPHARVGMSAENQEKFDTLARALDQQRDGYHVDAEIGQ